MTSRIREIAREPVTVPRREVWLLNFLLVAGTLKLITDIAGWLS